MMTQAATTTAGSTYRSAGLSAMTSGAFGIVAIAILFTGVSYMLQSKPELSGFVDLMFKTHAVGVILQSVFMVPVAFALDALARQQVPSVSRATLNLAIVSLSFIVLCELLWIANIVASQQLRRYLSYSAGTGSCSSGIDGFGRFIADLSIIVAA